MTFIKRLTIIIGVCLGSHSLFCQVLQKKIIELGWNYRDVSQLVTSLPQMQQSAFDGIAFSIQRYPINTFDTIELGNDYFLFDQLPLLKWNKLTDNFIYVWGASPAGAHWLSDSCWEIILNNTRKISRAVSLSNAKGILFDNEYYYSDPKNDAWKYNADWYNGRSYAEVAAVVKKRGMQFMKALELYKPDVKILMLSMFGSIIDQVQTRPMADNINALYLPFIEGLLSAKNGQSVIIDGNEHSYHYTSTEAYQRAKAYLHKSGHLLLPQSSGIDSISIGQAIFYDGIYNLFLYTKEKTRPEKDRFFTTAIRNALLYTDEYAWIYSEHLDWWQPGENESVVQFMTNEIMKQKKNVNQFKNGL